MYGNKKSGEITFYYNSEDLFDGVSMLSAYMAKNLGEESGDMLDEFCITKDEREAYDACVKQVLPHIYEAMMQLAIDSATERAFNDSEVVGQKETTGLQREVGTYVVFTIRDNGSYNNNAKSLVSDTLYDCLKYGILAEYYSVNANTELYRMSNDKFVSHLIALKSRLFQLKRRKVTSQFI
jgi:hypothetical protein